MVSLLRKRMKGCLFISKAISYPPLGQEAGCIVPISGIVQRGPMINTDSHTCRHEMTGNICPGRNSRQSKRCGRCQSQTLLDNAV